MLIGLPELRPEANTPRGAVAVGVDLGPLDLFHVRRSGIEGIVGESGGPVAELLRSRLEGRFTAVVDGFTPVPAAA